MDDVTIWVFIGLGVLSAIVLTLSYPLSPSGEIEIGPPDDLDYEVLSKLHAKPAAKAEPAPRGFRILALVFVCAGFGALAITQTVTSEGAWIFWSKFARWSLLLGIGIVVLRLSVVQAKASEARSSEAVTTVGTSIEGRLVALQGLKDKGLVTEEEYADHRAKILDDV